MNEPSTRLEIKKEEKGKEKEQERKQVLDYRSTQNSLKSCGFKSKGGQGLMKLWGSMLGLSHLGFNVARSQEDKSKGGGAETREGEVTRTGEQYQG